MEPEICDPGGRGLIFPLLESEQRWNQGFRAALYVLALLYLFLGVSVVADKFVTSIERITSKKKLVVKPGTGRMVTVTVWNATVANLTLMALGSSAPEILLSVIEIAVNGFHAGDLGPSTIVGSAAFNLFVIIAVCLWAIPSPEVRQVKERPVFFVTAVFSLFAYLWLQFIVQISSPDVVDVWEGVVTLLFFMLLLVASYAADKGYLSPGGKGPSLQKIGRLSFMTEEQLTDSLNIPSPARQISPASGEGAASVICRDATGRRINNDAGVLCFHADAIDYYIGEEAAEVPIPVYRRNGSKGKVTCRFATEGLSAVPGYDYVQAHGHLTFDSGEVEQCIFVKVLPKHFGESSDIFQVVIDEPTGGAQFDPTSDGEEERSLLTVTIHNTNEVAQKSSLLSRLDTAVNIDSWRHGLDAWANAIKAAIFEIGDGDDDDDDQKDDDQPSSNTFVELVLHCICLPWNLCFAVLVPPAALGGGWICFTFALIYIAGLTLFIIDFAELFGCVTGLDDKITAITLVSLGTSMPDLFASKISAVNDEWADASIVNVTGSNSVNVFLGIGLPWTIAAVYWAVVEPDEKWLTENADFLGKYPNGAFIVRGGDLGFSVIVFSIAALMALAIIHTRREILGGELGGPSGLKFLSAFTMFSLWVFYEALSIWKITSKEQSIQGQVQAIFFAIVGLENVILVVAGITFISSYCCRGSTKQVDDLGGGGIASERFASPDQSASVGEENGHHPEDPHIGEGRLHALAQQANIKLAPETLGASPRQEDAGMPAQRLGRAGHRSDKELPAVQGPIMPPAAPLVAEVPMAPAKAAVLEARRLLLGSGLAGGSGQGDMKGRGIGVRCLDLPDAPLPEVLKDALATIRFASAAMIGIAAARIKHEESAEARVEADPLIWDPAEGWVNRAPLTGHGSRRPLLSQPPPPALNHHSLDGDALLPQVASPPPPPAVPPPPVTSSKAKDLGLPLLPPNKDDGATPATVATTAAAPETNASHVDCAGASNSASSCSEMGQLPIIE